MLEVGAHHLFSTTTYFNRLEDSAPVVYCDLFNEDCSALMEILPSFGFFWAAFTASVM